MAEINEEVVVMDVPETTEVVSAEPVDFGGYSITELEPTETTALTTIKENKSLAYGILALAGLGLYGFFKKTIVGKAIITGFKTIGSEIKTGFAAKKKAFEDKKASKKQPAEKPDTDEPATETTAKTTK